MKRLLALALLVPSYLYASMIIDVQHYTEFVSRQEIIPGCETLDTYRTTTLTTYQDDLSRYYPWRSWQELAKPITYPITPNPCYREGASQEERHAHGCFPQELVFGSTGAGKRVVESESFHTVHTDTCDDCNKLIVPEPVYLFLLLTFAGILYKRGHRV